MSPRLARLLVALVAPMAVLGLTGVPAIAATPYHVTISTAEMSVDVGQSIHLHGTVSGGPVSGRQVAVYWTHDTSSATWHLIGSSNLSGSGAYSRAYSPTAGGDIRFKAVKSAESGHAGDSAYSASTEVYQWQSIWPYSGATIDGSGGATATRGNARVDGQLFTDALIINDGTQRFFTTDQTSCKAFRGAIGERDSSTANSGLMHLGQEDGDIAQVTAFHHRSAASLTMQVDPAEGLVFQPIIGSGGGTTNAMVVGRPQVLCNTST
jgi:hypothetical protein